ncbi:MAG: phospho-N-acetylmuramoyl-pentapeptide-transferase [Chroococcidiopsidaceae cyanobacterium CP_BM_RX_35]|nr:phospho-N-acetylmuramoyl-pentapeptide-transferase [Chroococcidiopsidaceae cyanobacterium CP_BM_RX_35]
MEAKSSSDRSPMSGNSLLLLLSTLLSVAALTIDWTANRLPWQGTLLTLPLWLCAIATAGLGYWVVPFLLQLKTGQVIREDGPQTHLKKAGTPTMGGVFFVPVAVAFALVWSGFAPEVVTVCILTLSYGTIGWLDDWQILRRQSNKGISPMMKLAMQVGFAIIFCLWLAWEQADRITTIALPFGFSLALGLLFWPLAALVLVAESNATNLTDGVDGLAGGTCAIALLGLGAIVAPTSPGLMIFCACMSGSCLGFLVHNRNPARVFMGDTGSLALGGALAAVALQTNTLWVLFVLSGIFFVETLSVMAQVSYYKATKGPDGVGKRLFKMAPLHHHLELSGWSETQVVGVFYAISGLLVLLCLLLYMSRLTIQAP